MIGDNILGFKHILIVGSILKYRRGLAEALLRHLNQPKFSVIDPHSRDLPAYPYDWSTIDLMIIDASKDKPAIRSWFFDYPVKEDMPPVIFIDNQATVDDAGDLVRAGAADYIDLRGLKRSRLSRALVIASAMVAAKTADVADGEYTNMEATQIIDAIQSLNTDTEDESLRPKLESVIVLDDPEATGLLPTVKPDMASAKEAPAVSVKETAPPNVDQDNPATEVLPQVNVASASKNTNERDKDRVAMAAMGILTEDIPAIKQTEPPAEAGQQLRKPSSAIKPESGNTQGDALAATGLMSILERNKIAEREEEHIAIEEPKPSFMGQKWPFTHGDIEQGRASLDGYDILQFIGVGGTASVFRVSRKSDGQEFAMKLFDTDSPDNLGRDRFCRGYELLKTIQHPNVCRIVELVNSGEHTFVILEYLPCGDLRSRINGGIERDEAVRYATQIGAALYSAHGQKIIHRDLKPSNVLFREDGTLALVDFGIAKQMAEIEQQMTRQGQVVGTPYYISPEQATGTNVGHHSDLYALGVILYEMLEGERPYVGESSMEIMTAHVNSPIPHLRNKGDALNGVVSRLLSKKPEDRFPSGRDLVLALKSICPNGVSLDTLKTVM